MKLPVISTQRFHYHAASRTFAADESDLGHDFRLGPITDCKCDPADEWTTLDCPTHSREYDGTPTGVPPAGVTGGIGFMLESQRTGQRITFGLSHEERDAEGGLQLTEFRPVDSDVDLRVVLFND